MGPWKGAGTRILSPRLWTPLPSRLLTLSLFGPESLYLLSSPQSGLGPLHNPDASVFTEAQPGLPDFQS